MNYPSGILKGGPCFCFRFNSASERPVALWVCIGEGLYPAETGEQYQQVTGKTFNICEQAWPCSERHFLPGSGRGKDKWCGGKPTEGGSALQKGCSEGRRPLTQHKRHKLCSSATWSPRGCGKWPWYHTSAPWGCQATWLPLGPAGSC